IAVAVAVEVTGGEGTWSHAALKRRAGRGVEQAGAVSQENRHRAGVPGASRTIGRGQVELAVVVEVVEHSLLRIRPDSNGRRRCEGAAAIEQYGYRAAAEMRNHQIGAAVIVDVSGGHGKGPETAGSQGSGR